jgi:hypothetical protein
LDFAIPAMKSDNDIGQLQQPMAFNFDLLNVINSNKQQEPQTFQPFGTLPIANQGGFDPFGAPLPTSTQNINTNTMIVNGLTSVTEKKVEEGQTAATNKQGWNLPDEFTGIFALINSFQLVLTM